MKQLILALAFCGLATPVFAFPDNAVLDTFAGCVDNVSPPNANWLNAVFQGTTSSTVDCEDLAATNTTGSDGDAYWQLASFGPDVEAYGTIAVGYGSTAKVSVLGRLVNIGASTTDGYGVEMDNGADTFRMFRLDDAVITQLGTGVSITPAAGDKIGLWMVGPTICSWYKAGAGAWTQRECVTDGNYSASGRIGMSLNGSNTNGILDDFGGGTITATARGRQSIWIFP